MTLTKSAAFALLFGFGVGVFATYLAMSSEKLFVNNHAQSTQGDAGNRALPLSKAGSQTGKAATTQDTSSEVRTTQDASSEIREGQGEPLSPGELTHLGDVERELHEVVDRLLIERLKDSGATDVASLKTLVSSMTDDVVQVVKLCRANSNYIEVLKQQMPRLFEQYHSKLAPNLDSADKDAVQAISRYILNGLPTIKRRLNDDFLKMNRAYHK